MECDMSATQTAVTGSGIAPSVKVWWNVFAFPSLQFICAVRDDATNPRTYDPRIGGDGAVIWQIANEPIQEGAR
jgi:hypothetical protein